MNQNILNELLDFQTSKLILENLHDWTIDTLYGSMYGLNHRFMSLKKALNIDFENILNYSVKRIKTLLKKEPTTFRKRSLPNIRQVGFGTYGWKYDPRLIYLAVKKGLLIDTAEGYGYGRVETEIGRALAYIEKEPNITTKVTRSHMSPKALPNAAKRSLNKLGVVPHYQIHFPHNKYSDETLGEILVSLRRSGIIKSIGLGNCSIDMIESMQSFLSDYSGDIITTIQVEYNLLNRRIEKTIIPYCQKRGIAIIIYSPLGQKFNKLKKPILDRISKQYRCTAAQVALAWILRHKGVIPIPRTNNIQHMKENINAVNIHLSKETIQEFNRAYPYRRFHGLL